MAKPHPSIVKRIREQKKREKKEEKARRKEDRDAQRSDGSPGIVIYERPEDDGSLDRNP